MKPFLQIHAGSTTVAPNLRILKAKDYATFMTAGEVLDQAKVKAKTIEKEAENQRKKQFDAGYQEGLKQARRHVVKEALKLPLLTSDYLFKFEGQINDIVLSAVKKIIGELPEKELCYRITKEALKQLANQHRVTIRVAPKQIPVFNELRHNLAEDFPKIEVLDIKADPQLQDDNCVIESEFGVIQAGLTEQFGLLQKALASALGASQSLK